MSNADCIVFDSELESSLDLMLSTISGSDQKQEMILNILFLFSVNYRFNQHLNLITTENCNHLNLGKYNVVLLEKAHLIIEQKDKELALMKQQNEDLRTMLYLLKK